MADTDMPFDQTLPEWLSKRKEGDLGTALFGTVTYENGRPEAVVHAIGDIDYHKALDFAQHSKSFKWVPHSVINTDDVHILCATEGLVCYHIVTCGAGCMCYGIGTPHCMRPRAIYKLVD